MERLHLSGAWLTVNRICNFRCPWCYVDGGNAINSQEDMELTLAIQLIDLFVQIGVHNVIFIGGEPTLWKHLFNAREMVSRRGMSATLVTNGSRVNTAEFAEQLRIAPFDAVTISLKAATEEQYRAFAGKDAFKRVSLGISSLSRAGVPCQVSITLNALFVDDLPEMVRHAIAAGARSVSIEFCSPVFTVGGPQRRFMLTPQETVHCILTHYEILDKVTDGRLTIEQSIPFCLWPNDFLATLKARGQIMSGCHVMRREGIIFDTQGNLIPCNTLWNCQLGRFGVDFIDAESLFIFLEREDARQFYDLLTAYPTERCASCESFNECCGGCPLIWFVHNPELTIPLAGITV